MVMSYRRLCATFVTTLALLLACSAAFAAIIRVSPTGNDSNDGSTWTLAKKTVQAAINSAAAEDEIWVEAGTYVESISMKDGVGLYGGFAGSETERNQRDWKINITILDANQHGRVVTFPSGASSATAIDGFTIRNGGTGVGCGLSSATISNDSIVDNSDSGISCRESTATITNNLIENNHGQEGGGISCEAASPVIENNTIVGNTASTGGGISCYESPNAVIVNNIIGGNSAFWNGGGISCDSTSPVLTNNTITGNTAGVEGGGLYCYMSQAAVANNIVAFNSSGIASSFATPALRNNCVYGNAVYNYSGLSEGVGDITMNPMLADLRYGNVHIQPGSPCIDAGWSDAPGLPSTDIDGQPRVQGGSVDIGADESDGTTRAAGPYIVVRVSTSGNDANDGSSWSSAMRTVQAAIAAATAKGGDVWVEAGLYSEHITLASYAYVYGGFDGTETERTQRNWHVNRTVLDGGGTGAVVSIVAGDKLSCIDGFTIRNGAGNSVLEGGGIYCDTASPTIANNTVTGNSGSFNGGGIYCHQSGALITHNRIVGNSTSIGSGGGVYLSDCNFAILSDNAIAGNGAAGRGGGVYIDSGACTITGNTVAANCALYGGGIDCESSVRPTISNNIVAFNSSGIDALWVTPPSLRNNCVYGNTAYDYSSRLSAGTGDISLDPMFTDLRYGNLHIQPDSPCIGAGWSAAPGLGATDIDGQPRVQGGSVDIGMDESDGTTWAPGPYATIRVSPDGDDANDGSTWALAKRTVQAGIDAASLAGGDVWVKAGVYGKQDTLAPFTYVFGGFNGTETQRNSRDWVSHKTTIDGGGTGNAASVLAGWKVSGIDGFTVQGGSRIDGQGGIYCNASSPTISHIIAKGNNGAGIYCDRASAPDITNCTVQGNTHTGIYCIDADPTITNNVIADNSNSGISANISTASITITNNTIVGNSSYDGGAIYFNTTFFTLSNNIIAFNSSGIYSDFGGAGLRNNCLFRNGKYDYSGLVPGAGDISQNPMFVSWPTDLHILPISPCRDAGYDAAVQPGWLDMDDQPRIQGPQVDIGADEFDPSATATTVGWGKLSVDGTLVSVIGVPVTAAFDGFFYVETPDRACGIRVVQPSAGVSSGDLVQVAGSVKTNSDGERYIDASQVTEAGTLSLSALTMRPAALGGGDWFTSVFPGLGQEGVTGGHGLNNIGLLVRTFGTVVATEPGFVYISDGSGVPTGETAPTGLKVSLPAGVAAPPSGSFVLVTGISSCYKSGNSVYPLLLVPDTASIQALLSSR